MPPVVAWIIFGATLVVFLAVDLSAHRAGEDSSRHALAWSGLWIAVGLGFGVVVWALSGAQRAQEYYAAYLIEESLSVDNLFVFMLILGSLEIPRQSHRRALVWGILAALVLRGALIFAGTAALERWNWLDYVFGAVLVWAVWRMLKSSDEQTGKRLIGWLSRHLPVTPKTHRGRFFVRREGHLSATPLVVAVIALELTDLAFATDSIPAALSVSHDNLVVFTSNALAVVGLRSLYVVVVGYLERVRYLTYGLAALLAFASLKLLLHDVVQIPAWASVVVIVAMLLITLIASVVGDHRARAACQ